MSYPIYENLINRALKLLASMPFAIGILLLVSSVSVIGTLIAQNRSHDYYRSTYGDTWQQLISVASFDNVYHAWWFVCLLGCLFVSLLAAIWRHSTRILNNNRLLKEIPPINERPSSATQMSKTGSINTSNLVSFMRMYGFNEYLQSIDNKQHTLFFRKGQWGKLGFLPIHLGIAIIISGGFVTSQWGLRGVMNIVDGETSNLVHIPDGESFRSIELPFKIRNNGFGLDHYTNGMPSNYRSNLDIFKQNQLLVSKEIIVNDPLTIGDITVYQSSYGDAGSAVNISITDLSRPDFVIQQLDSAVHKILEDDVNGTRFTITELRQQNVMNLSTNPLTTVMRNLGPSIDIRLQSSVDGTITYRVYKNYPNMIAFTRLGDTEMTTFNLGMSPADHNLVKLLSSYLQNTSTYREQNLDTRRKALRHAMTINNTPLSKAGELGPIIINAADVLSQHKLPALFQLNAYEQKLYTGLQVSKDPGANIIWTGSILLLLGLLMFYVSEYRIWLIIDQQENSSQIRLVISSNRVASISLHYLMGRLVNEFQSNGFIIKGYAQ